VPLGSALHVEVNKKYAVQYAKHLNLPSIKGATYLIRSLLKGYESNYQTDLFHPVDEYQDTFCGLSDGVFIEINFRSRIPNWLWPEVITSGGDLIWITPNFRKVLRYINPYINVFCLKSLSE